MGAYNFGIGSAEEWDTYTLISTADEFIAIGSDSANLSKNYVLGNNIDLGGAEITPIGSLTEQFTGKFSGSGYTISNVNISRANGNGSSWVGLFAYNSGLIMDLSVKGNVSGSDYIGGICGSNSGTIYCCSFEGNVQAGSNVGGICGINCYQSADKIGKISNCYVLADITATEAGNAGGICGSVSHYDATVKNCYFSGKVKVPANCAFYPIGAGYTNGISNCYYNTDFCTSYSNETNAIKGLTTIQMTDSNALTTMNLDAGLWSKKANIKGRNGGTAYYPTLNVFSIPIQLLNILQSLMQFFPTIIQS